MMPSWLMSIYGPFSHVRSSLLSLSCSFSIHPKSLADPPSPFPVNSVQSSFLPFQIVIGTIH